LVETTADLKVDQAVAEDEKILECLGAAVIMLWSSLPTKIQQEFFEHATSLADLAPTAPWKREIARFLHIARMMALKRRRPLPRHVVM
jgi:hypothetical protein